MLDKPAILPDDPEELRSFTACLLAEVKAQAIVIELAGWVGKTTALLEPLADAIGRHVLSAEAIFADGTPEQMLAPGTGKTITARLWTTLAQPLTPCFRRGQDLLRKDQNPGPEVGQRTGREARAGGSGSRSDSFASLEGSRRP